MAAREPKYDDLRLPETLKDAGDASPWFDAVPFPEQVNQFSFISGNRESRAIRVHYYEKKSARLFAGRAWFGPETVGPPGHAHGGSQAALLDEGGRELDMGTGFDDMTELSHPALEARFVASGDITAAQIANRQLLRDAMFQAGFVGINTEWWHFDCGDRNLVRQAFRRVL